MTLRQFEKSEEQLVHAECTSQQHRRKKTLLKEWRYLIAEYKILLNPSISKNVFEGDKGLLVLAKMKALNKKLRESCGCSSSSYS